MDKKHTIELLRTYMNFKNFTKFYEIALGEN